MLKAPLSQYFPPEVAHIISPEEADKIRDALGGSIKEIEQYGGDPMLIGIDLDTELSRQAQTYHKIVDRAALVDTTVDTLKTALDALTAFAALKTREAYEDEDVFVLPFKTNNMQFPKLAKATEGIIEKSVDSYDMVLALNQLLTNAKYVQTKFKGASDSWLQRSIMLSKLSERTSRLMMMPDSYTVDAARGAMARERK